MDLQNAYYNAKGELESDPQKALEGFAEVVSMEEDKGEWGFRALKQSIKCLYRLGRYAELMDKYKELLTYIKSAVTRNYSEKSITKILDYVSGATDKAFLESFFETTLQALAEEAKNERLWFKTQLKLCSLHFAAKDFPRMGKILKELHKSCQSPDGTDDQKKGTQLLEAYAIEIQVYTETKDNKRLKQLYNQALTIKSAIAHPKIMGIIRECGGKMHLAERQWEAAATDFFEAFKSYDEAGVARRVQCLKYLVMCNMLMESQVNPFDSQEARPYRQDPEVLAMTNLVSAYQRNEIGEFEQVLRTHRDAIMGDPFVKTCVGDLLKNVRTQVLLKLIKPYTRIRIPFVSKELNIPEAEVEELLVSVVLDGRISGHIDQVNQLLVLEAKGQEDAAKKYASLDKWSTQLKNLQVNNMARLLPL